MTNTPETLPCPCCGCAETYAENTITEATVRCRRCSLSMRRYHSATEDDGLPASIAAWNRRAPQDREASK